MAVVPGGVTWGTAAGRAAASLGLARVPRASSLTRNATGRQVPLSDPATPLRCSSLLQPT